MSSSKSTLNSQQSSFEKIQMVDVRSQYLKIKEEVDAAIHEVIDSCMFINGPAVKRFQASLETYLGVEYVVPCANGTDALQLAMMAVGLKPGDEVILPAFTYVATAEVVALLGLTPVMIDVDPQTFCITAEAVKEAITPKTRAVVPVNLYGQTAELEGIRQLADTHGFYMIEDNAQAIGSDVTLSDGTVKKSGTIGHIGCTSFYPSKNLGAYGDAGAIYTDDADLAKRLRMAANHGQQRTYKHDTVGCNSRLDSIQAAVLDVKLKHLDRYASARQLVADHYDLAFINTEALDTPSRIVNGSHVFHQYTLKVTNGKRDALKEYLAEQGIPSMIYYPIPLYKQEAYRELTTVTSLPHTEHLCERVISLPMHTEMPMEQIKYITKAVNSFLA